jgi:serine/threonine protein phosphatase PrpC
MIDRWYYTHNGQTLGPVPAAQLRQLAAEGRLCPNDLIWPQGRQRSEAVPAQAALEFASQTAPAVPLTNKPDWLDDIRTLIKAEKKPTQPDWLDDVRAAEAEEQAFLTLEWDGDNAVAEEEKAKQILDELEKASESESMSEFIPEAATPCRLLLGSATTRGRVRDRNEDSLLVQQCTWSNQDKRHDVALIVVADGMGGHSAGEQASALVVRTISGMLTPLLSAALSEQSADAALADPSKVLDRGLHEANRLVREAALRNLAWKGMGSTAVALLIWDGRVWIRLVGDCRVYHWHGGKLAQVTRDQTLVARMVELGQLTPEEAEKHPRRNEVAQAVGKYALIEPARYEISLSPSDWLLASSDGLQAHVSDRVLGETIAKAGTSAAELANRLVELANQGGGSDNCTVVALRCV